MKFKKLVVIMMAVLVMAASTVAGTTPSKAAEQKKPYTNREVKMLATIIYCEAGNQSYAGKLAVGVIIMNRKKSKAFPNSVEGVIKQKFQFSPVRTGKWAREMKLYKKGAYKKGAKAQCVKAAKEALEGAKSVKYRGKEIKMQKYHFFSQRLSSAKLRIEGHDFK